MYGMLFRQQLTVWPGKLILCKKTPLIFAYFGGHESELPDWQTVDTRLTSGLPLKTLGYDGSTSYVGGQWHQNLAHMSPQHFFPLGTRKLAKK